MRLKNGIFAGIMLLASGCANQDIIVQKQAEMESRIEYLAQGNKVLNGQLTALSNDLNELKERVRNNSSALRKMSEPSVRPTDEAKEPAVQGERAASLKPAVTRIELINADAKRRGKTDSSSAAYMRAFGLYSANKYPEAIEAFTDFLKKYPDAEYAVNAQYWIGECYYSTSDMPKALESFRTVVEKYPAGKKVPDALLKTGYTLSAMKETEKARSVFESLVEKYPDSTAAAKARERLVGY